MVSAHHLNNTGITHSMPSYKCSAKFFKQCCTGASTTYSRANSASVKNSIYFSESYSMASEMMFFHDPNQWDRNYCHIIWSKTDSSSSLRCFETQVIIEHVRAVKLLCKNFCIRLFRRKINFVLNFATACRIIKALINNPSY